ncbi:uncharacterized protein TNCV_832471 [Trichonephila clavipes]|nr:uncharacterized protein TNCV_832471 [Trichonephila clavipes]
MRSQTAMPRQKSKMLCVCPEPSPTLTSARPTWKRREGNSTRKMILKEDKGSTAATRGLLETDHVILNHGHVTWSTPELAPPLLTTTLHQRKDVSTLDRFGVHRCPTWWVFSGTRLELVTKPATIRYLYHSATAATTVDRMT